MIRLQQIIITLLLASLLSAGVLGEEANSQPIQILHPKKLSGADVEASRTPLGIPNDYKPFIAQLKNGELLVVAFCFGPVEGIDGYVERAVFWRSKDGGTTWGPREERIDIQGREFGLTTLHDGTILMTCHWLAHDALNPSKHTHSKVFRSVDNGTTWSETRIGPDGFPDGAETVADWMAFEIPDKKNPGQFITSVGVSMQHGKENAPRVVRIWQSRDSGKTWDRSFHPDTAGWIDVDGFFSQTVTFRAANGHLFHPVRVDRTGPHWHIPGTPEVLDKESGDQGDRMMLFESTDNGLCWKKHRTHGNFGHYGEMYPRFIQLKDGRLLLTFTVRSNSTDGHELGVRAIISDDNGASWDFRNDRMVISDVNYGSSGGGFGNTVQLDDGNLVSVYSYRREDMKTYIEAVRWSLPETK